MNFEHLDLDKLKTYSLNDRNHLVSKTLLVEPEDPPGDFMAGFPEILATNNLRLLCKEGAAAYNDSRKISLAMGAHVIKCGLSLLIIDLMERGILTSVSLNGAGAIHDFEMAFCGGTSEDVLAGLRDGSFGMARETAEAVNGAAVRAADGGRGLGETLGAEIEESDLPFKHASIVAAGARLGVPVTVHVSLGCDIVHMHPSADGAAIGAASMNDFRTLCSLVSSLEGGVWLNIGSSVVLPEVFLKALSVSRNLTGGPNDFLTADFDMIRHYRTQKNVVERPSGRGMHITGHHEMLVPLFRWGMILELARIEKGGEA